MFKNKLEVLVYDFSCAYQCLRSNLLYREYIMNISNLIRTEKQRKMKSEREKYRLSGKRVLHAHVATTQNVILFEGQTHLLRAPTPEKRQQQQEVASRLTRRLHLARRTDEFVKRMYDDLSTEFVTSFSTAAILRNPPPPPRTRVYSKTDKDLTHFVSWGRVVNNIITVIVFIRTTVVAVLRTIFYVSTCVSSPHVPFLSLDRT